MTRGDNPGRSLSGGNPSTLTPGSVESPLGAAVEERKEVLFQRPAGETHHHTLCIGL